MEIVGQLRSWPQDEEWLKLVREYDQMQSAQAESGWVLRAPAAVPPAGPSRPVAGAPLYDDGREREVIEEVEAVLSAL